MPKTIKNTHVVSLLAGAVGALAAVMPVQAAEGPAADVMPSTLALIEAMVESGVIDVQQARDILDNAKVRDAERAVKLTPPPVKESEKRVIYVPEIVKQELREEIKKEVMATAEAENWAAPNTHPEWTERIKVFGDLRGRYEGVYFPDGNATGYDVTDAWDFNAINTGKPIDVTGLGTVANDRYHNVDKDRQRTRLRARLGIDADLGEGFTTKIRLATGSGNSPVSTNQSLGGSGGNFSKYQVWLDRAALRWHALHDSRNDVVVKLGRFDNPFFGTSLVWDGDLGFDGLSVTGRYNLSRKVRPFATLGAFPIYNTSFNISSEMPEKQESRDKWLFGLQGGTDWKPNKDIGVKVGAAVYRFTNIEGKESSPCALWDSSVSCDTDYTRPSFAQKGNTYMALRTEAAGRPAGTNAEYQYFGLATPFQELALTGRVDYAGLKGLRVALDGEFVKNVAFDEDKVADKAWNNQVCNGSNNCKFEGGDLGYLMRLTVGSPEMKSRWDWSTSLAYKYVESDAVVDGLTDSDFGLGGTNLKGFILGGNLQLAKNVRAGLRWMSADSIAGAPFSEDTFLVDLMARF